MRGFFLGFPGRVPGVKSAAPSRLPESLEPRWVATSARLAELPPALLERPEMARSVGRVALCSDFVLSILQRHGEELVARLADSAPLSHRRLREQVELGGLDERQAMAELRRMRNVEMARIAWRDLAGWADLETCLTELSVLADCAIELAVDIAAQRLKARYGEPGGSQGERLPLLVLAMGKLGGGELNFSSDVDLVLLHPEGASLTGPEPIDPQGYYRKLSQLMIKLLDQVTEDGFVFRVDTRLRPFGSSGPLVVSVPAFESYLLRHGRDWERYAYVKARLVTGTEHSREVFDDLLTPFVYRRYLDFGVFEALRQMKSLIAQEVARRDLADNIKLGPGGIREIEFIVQSHQLVRGGREPSLQERSLLRVLPRLAESPQVGESTVGELERAYRYLRTLENRLQAMQDRQVHDLPRDPETRAALAYAMGERDWQELVRRLSQHCGDVQSHFARLALHGHEDRGESAVSVRTRWEAGDVPALLVQCGLEENGEGARLLAGLRDGPLYRRMDEPSRQRLAGLVARLLPMVAPRSSADRLISRLIPLLQAVARRSAYLALLTENPTALERLLQIADESEFLVRRIVEHPLLLDELLDARVFELPPTREELERGLQQDLAGADLDDVESLLEAMRQFQRAAVFRVAVADRLGHLPLMKVSDRLTDIAELILALALETAWNELTAKYGKPTCLVGNEAREAGFGIIGYGKLGGLELGYGSDLDLVFLHDSEGERQQTSGTQALDNGRFFARLAQRLIHFLGIQTSSGRLYEVDMRLRPGGNSGLMVPSLSVFRRYQRSEAWVWEHQALLRSRSVAGDARVLERFERERREVLIGFVNREQLKEEVRSMRERMRAELSLSKSGQFDIKQDPGGLADIEFLVDYWVLAHARELPELVEFPDNVRQLEALERTGVVPAERCRGLKALYLRYRERSHELALDEGGRVVDAGDFAEPRAWIEDLWKEEFSASSRQGPE